jgi:hypothetical protein
LSGCGIVGEEMEKSERPLSRTERRLLTGRLCALRGRKGLLRRRVGLAVAAVVGPLWLLTLLGARDLPWWGATAPWAGLAGAIGLWVLQSEKGNARSAAALLERALRFDQVQEQRVRASELVEVEEGADEGACWLFQLPGDRVLVLAGQEYYETARFPSDDFSLVDIRLDGGGVLEQLIQPHGHKLQPGRRLPAAFRGKLPLDREEPVVLAGTVRGLTADI